MVAGKLLLLLLLLLFLLAKFSQGVQLQIIQAPVTNEDLPKFQLQTSTSEKILVELYYESLCPYSATFIVNALNKLFSNGLISSVDLHLIPYGNARITADGSIICQHGSNECKLNLIETCSINLWPVVDQYFPFIYCVEDLVLCGKSDLWLTCANKTGLHLDSILNCYSSPIGMKWQKDFARKTDSLDPPHKYVPWVLVNGQPLYEDYENVAQYICDLYLGSKPDACTNVSIPAASTKLIGKFACSHKHAYDALI